jgi:hypothetical protein
MGDIERVQGIIVPNAVDPGRVHRTDSEPQKKHQSPPHHEDDKVELTLEAKEESPPATIYAQPDDEGRFDIAV